MIGAHAEASTALMLTSQIRPSQGEECIQIRTKASLATRIVERPAHRLDGFGRCSTLDALAVSPQGLFGADRRLRRRRLCSPLGRQLLVRRDDAVDGRHSGLKAVKAWWVLVRCPAFYSAAAASRRPRRRWHCRESACCAIARLVHARRLHCRDVCV